MTTMTSTESESGATDRSAAFAAAVSESKLNAPNATADKLGRTLGIGFMILGVVGTFVAYNSSRSMDDSRNVASMQILALVFLAFTVVGAAIYLAGSVAKVLRLWLLRQLVESQDRMDQLTEALKQK
jgi:uncharacterized membrane protein YeaQ/YmgE (transglycosylase-associated protein family)